MNAKLKNTFHLSLLPSHFSVFTSYFLTFAFSLFTLNSCTPTEPPKPEKPKLIELKEITKSCTEIFIKVSTKDTLLPVNVTIKRDGKKIINYYQTKTDTVIADTGLTENKTYGYQAIVEGKGEEGKSKEMEITTLPVTSGNYTWQTYTFGNSNYGSSMLRDVAIIDENDIWAVGEIYADTTGHAYNAVHWNGNKWELKRISVKYHNYFITPPLFGIYVFSTNDIWLSSGVPIHGDGVNWTLFHLFDMGVLSSKDGHLTKIWGNSSSNLYYVGNLGTIAHYDGTNWTKIESGTSLNINGIYGIYKEGTKEEEILAVGGNILHDTERIILKITGENQAEIINPQGTIDYPLSSIWFSKNVKYYVGGSGLYTKYYNENIWKEISVHKYFIFSISGNGLNDIAVCGGIGYVAHFNGINWKNYLENGLEQISGNYYSLSMKGNKICVVGIANGKAVAIIGTR